jgi:hypothetical protein
MMIDTLLFLLLVSHIPLLARFLTQHPDAANPRLAARADGTIRPINRFIIGIQRHVSSCVSRL